MKTVHKHLNIGDYIAIDYIRHFPEGESHYKAMEKYCKEHGLLLKRRTIPLYTNGTGKQEVYMVCENEVEE